MNDLEFLHEGHYRDDQNGKEYMSIWTFKQQNGMGKGTNEKNHEDAKMIKCNDKYWMPFTQSENFKSGWVYNINDLKKIYSI